MPKAGRRRRRENPETAARKKTTTRSRADDRRLQFAAFESEKAQRKPKLDGMYDDDVAECSSEESSSCPPSPLLHRPYIPGELAHRPDIHAGFKHAKAEYQADKACRFVFTLDRCSSISCLSHQQHLLHIREPAKDAVLSASNSIITLSSYLDDEPLNRCCGLWIQRDDEKSTAVVLTSAHLIRAKDPDQWMDEWTGEYHRKAELSDDGGPVIDLEGKVVGMVNNQVNETFLPSSILHKCLDSWRKFKCIPRPHLGMTFTSIKLLDPICTERMRRKHNIESGLIVEEVSKESNAEKLGIRKGDIIERFNGEYISSTIELEKMLLDIGSDHFEQAKRLNAEIDVQIQIFRATRLCRRTRNLTVIISDCGEDIIEGLTQ
ncbi:uncharacterized protein LOC123397597 [Hordeum vulgare subsp. vulgare]|uniref:uncharacterized protein LOC123397597 n=1 Tax=Hordeum vulgare subsp. vulgare TaxID=112509 RepID=UPI001D1A5AE1|nr:uncharacterized protein LOC123397597 [Hordeum vulgare subsp. vulgare]